MKKKHTKTNGMAVFIKIWLYSILSTLGNIYYTMQPIYKNEFDKGLYKPH